MPKGDMMRDQGEPEYEVTAQQPYSDEAEASKVAGMLRRQAVSRKTGALVDVDTQWDKNTKQNAYVVRVHNPRKGQG